MIKRPFVLGLGVALVAGCQPTADTEPATTAAEASMPTVEALLADGGHQMSDAELQALFVDKTVDHVHRTNGEVATITHHDDGTRELIFKGKTYSDTSYQIRGNQRCDISIADGQEYCMTVIAMADEITLCDPRHDGECRWVIHR